MLQTTASHTVSSRICAYPTCWRDVVTDAPTPVIGVVQPVNQSLLCANHEQQVHDDLTWLARNLDDLEHYRINRAYGHKQGGGSPSSGNASTPLRETLSDLLYRTDDLGYPGLQPTLYEWALSLTLLLQETSPLTVLVDRIRHCYRLMENPATPVYARELHSQTRRLRRFLEPGEDATIILGPCPATGCATPLVARIDAKDVECAHCHSRWNVAWLKRKRRERILTSTKLGTQTELITMLKTCGITIKQTTLRSWVHRGQLKQAGENSMSKPIYRLADVYQLATGTTTDNENTKDES